MKFKQYYIADRYGMGLKYIGGALYWSSPDTLEELLDFTPFDTEREAKEFCAERHIDFACILKYTVKV